MKPTSDERRDVAEKLREPFDVLPQGRYYHAHYTLFGMGLYASSEGALRLGVRRLADLIDPAAETCELELTCSDRAKAWIRTFECSRCGKSCDNVYGEDYEYCPYCGRRAEHADE